MSSDARKRLVREETGFALTEVLVTMMIMMVVLFALYGIFDMTLRVFSFGNDKIEATEQARLGLERMTREIRAAYPVDKISGKQHVFFTAGAFATATRPGASSITFGNDLPDAATPPNRMVDTTEEITYELRSSSNLSNACPTSGTDGICTLVRRKGSTASFEPVVEYVVPNGLTFEYLTNTMGTTDASIMIVLIGVMGAGLLTFVSRDLDSVIEVNQGQRAQEMANAGLEAAKYQLSIVDALPSSYDSAVPAGNSTWYDNGTPGSGKTLTFSGNQIVVGIRYLPPPSNTTQARDPNYAPEMLPTYYKPDGSVDTCTDANGDGLDDDFNLTSNPPDYDACNYKNNRNYFRVTVRGNSGSAVRAVQAIYQAENFGAVPLSNYASRDIDFNGNSTDIRDMSIFASRNLLNFRGDKISGTDYAYGDWATIPGSGGAPNQYNATPRRDASGNPVTVAGAGFLGSITYSPSSEDPEQKNKIASPQYYGYRDYDMNTDQPPISRPEFTTNTWGALASQPTTKMTFPFAPPGSASDDNPIYSTKGKAIYKAKSTNADSKVKGIIVVVNGNLDTSPSADTFQGAMVIRDPNDTDTTGASSAINCNDTSTSFMYFCNSGNVTMEGYVNIEGDMKLGGNISGLLPSELFTGLPSLVKVSRWSWRECYNTTCS